MEGTKYLIIFKEPMSTEGLMGEDRAFTMAHSPTVRMEWLKGQECIMAVRSHLLTLIKEQEEAEHLVCLMEHKGWLPPQGSMEMSHLRCNSS